jgi:hypothetical protein
MHIARIVRVGVAVAAVVLAAPPTLGATRNSKGQPAALTAPPSTTLHCRKGQCSTRDIKVVVDDRGKACTLKVEYETVSVNGGNRGLSNQGVKLRWVIDDANAKNRWFFYPGGVALAKNNGDFKDDGPDDAKKSYGLTDANSKDEEFSTAYTVVVMDKDRKAKCTGEATIENKRGGGRKRKAHEG